MKSYLWIIDREYVLLFLFSFYGWKPHDFWIKELLANCPLRKLLFTTLLLGVVESTSCSFYDASRTWLCFKVGCDGMERVHIKTIVQLFESIYLKNGGSYKEVSRHFVQIISWSSIFAEIISTLTLNRFFFIQGEDWELSSFIFNFDTMKLIRLIEKIG